MNRGRPRTIKDPVRVLLTLDEGTIKALNFYMNESGLTRTQIIRTAIDLLLSGEGGVKDGESKPEQILD